MSAMWLVESEGYRIGPDWFPEASFDSREAAVAWLAENAYRLPEGRDIRIHRESESEVAAVDSPLAETAEGVIRMLDDAKRERDERRRPPK